MLGKQHKQHDYYVKGFSGNPYHDTKKCLICIKKLHQ